MAKTAAKPKPKTPRELASELIQLHVQHRPVFRQIDELKDQLKGLATEAGQSLREVFEGIGKVSASGNRDRQFKGDLPELDADVWNKLSDKDRQRLLAKGVVKITPTYSRPYYGQVTVDLY